MAWAFAGHWFDRPALPRRGGGAARLSYHFTGHAPSTGEFSPKEESWQEESRRDGALVLYARANGAFLVCDPFRFDDKAPAGGEFEGRQMQLFGVDERGVLQGVASKSGALITNGLLRDWATWQFQYPETFHKFQACLRGLSAQLGEEELKAGTPVRLSTRDSTDTPTLKLPYGEVPITHLSAGMRRVMGLAYMLVWVAFEHRKAAEVLQQPPLRSLALLVDEIEAHLHPRWQRSILPSLLNVARELMPEVDVQIFASTHAPLVTASLETHFDPERDALFEFELEGGEVRVERATFRRIGEVNDWLTSEVDGARGAALEGRSANPRRKSGAVNTLDSIRRQPGTEVKAPPSLGRGSRAVRICTEGARPHRGASFDLRFTWNLLPPTSVGGSPRPSTTRALALRVRSDAPDPDLARA
ncbi:MAG: ATP-binding protein [Polyangiaceae bacterium]|nr:ATP-binding protein [Polyangiaceae bacterium]